MPNDKAVKDQHIPEYNVKKQVTIGVSIFIALILFTAGIVLFAKGYRFGFSDGTPKLAKTGILNATSSPKGAQVRINDHLTTATNNTVNLTPGKYTIKIEKDGYTSWQKDVVIKQQLVTETDALLFPSAPALQSIAAIGVEQPVLDPSSTKIAFRIASQSAKKNGIYVLDMTSRTFPVLAVQSAATQVIDDTLDTFSKASYTWSPDGSQLLASIPNTTGNPTYYLLNATSFNTAPRDVTAVLPSIVDAWKALKLDKEKARLNSLPKLLSQTIQQDFTILDWSPDDTKVLYQASQSASLPIIINPRRIGNNPLYEVRDIKQGGIYVYDTKEDVNTKILDALPDQCADLNLDCLSPLSWYPDSAHLIYVHDRKIDIVDDDGANLRTIYAGPFVPPYAYSWPDGSKIVIITNLGNVNIQPTFYTISLR